MRYLPLYRKTNVIFVSPELSILFFPLSSFALASSRSLDTLSRLRNRQGNVNSFLVLFNFQGAGYFLYQLPYRRQLIHYITIETLCQEVFYNFFKNLQNPRTIVPLWIRPFRVEAPPRFELGIRVLQTHALPLGYSAGLCARGAMERITRLELATSTLARWRSTR